MKTLIAAALVALAAAPVAAQQVGSGAAAAIAHFNQDFDSQDGRVSLAAANLGAGVTVSTRGGALGGVFDRFNADFDGQDDVRGQTGATVISGNPAVAADLHARIRAEGREDE